MHCHVGRVALVVGNVEHLQVGLAARIILRRRGAEQIPMLLDLLRRTNRITRQNVTWGVGYNLCALPLALLGYIPPLIAAIAMVFSSLSVSLNSGRNEFRHHPRRRGTSKSAVNFSWWRQDRGDHDSLHLNRSLAPSP
jgi:hypothetical protein